MKRTAFAPAVGVVLLALGLCGMRAAYGQESAAELPRLRAENTVLKAEIAAFKVEIAALKRVTELLREEVAILKVEKEKLARQTNTPGIVVSGGAGVVYEGEPRTKEWFEQMYVRYCNKVILVDGETIIISDVNSGTIGSYHAPDGMWRAQPPVGALLSSPEGAEVLSVISNSEYLVIRHGYPSQTYANGFGFVAGLSELLFHVKGMGAGLVDKAPFPETWLVCVGTYHYGAASGAAKTVQSYIVYPPPPITREQFAAALKQGFKVDTTPPKADKAKAAKGAKKDF